VGANTDWGPSVDEQIEIAGSYRFDDPQGRVGMESFLVRSGDTLLHIPLTYRDEPLAGAENALITQTHHSVLGNRWVYDGLADPVFVMMLAAVSLTGQGEALGMAYVADRWRIVPANVRIQGGGWTQERVPIDQFTAQTTGVESTFTNDRFELLVHRRPVVGSQPPIGLTATWDTPTAPVVLAEIRER
jgi:hypothetical protein